MLHSWTRTKGWVSQRNGEFICSVVVFLLCWPLLWLTTNNPSFQTYDIGYGPQTMMAYVDPDINTMYRGNPPSSTRVVPKFNGLSVKVRKHVWGFLHRMIVFFLLHDWLAIFNSFAVHQHEQQTRQVVMGAKPWWETKSHEQNCTLRGFGYGQLSDA